MKRPPVERSDDPRRHRAEHIRQHIALVQALGKHPCADCGQAPASHLVDGTRGVCNPCADRRRRGRR